MSQKWKLASGASISSHYLPGRPQSEPLTHICSLPSPPGDKGGVAWACHSEELAVITNKLRPIYSSMFVEKEHILFFNYFSVSRNCYQCPWQKLLCMFKILLEAPGL